MCEPRGVLNGMNRCRLRRRRTVGGETADEAGTGYSFFNAKTQRRRGAKGTRIEDRRWRMAEAPKAAESGLIKPNQIESNRFLVSGSGLRVVGIGDQSAQKVEKRA